MAAPLSATPLFRWESQIDVPLARTIDELPESVRLIGDGLGVDIKFARGRNSVEVSGLVLSP